MSIGRLLVLAALGLFMWSASFLRAAELLDLQRDWIVIGRDPEPIRFSFEEPSPNIIEPALAGDIKILWDSTFIDVTATVDYRIGATFLDCEFVVPPELRTPGITELALWDAAANKKLAHRGRVVIGISAPAEVFELSSDLERIAAYVPGESGQTGGRVDIYSTASGNLASSVPVDTTHRVLAFAPDARFAWLNTGNGAMGRLDLQTLQIDRTIPFDAGRAQVDRDNPDLVIVQPPGIGPGPYTTFFNGTLLPGVPSAWGYFPLPKNPDGRYLLYSEACKLDPILGFTECESLPDSAEAVWGDKIMNGSGIFDRVTGAQLSDVSGRSVFYLPQNDQLVTDRLAIVNGTTLETQYVHYWAGDDWYLDEVRSVRAPDWILARGWVQTAKYESTPLIVFGRWPELGPAPIIAPDGIRHGGAFTTGAISPGQIVSIFGNNLAADIPSRLTWESNIALGNEISGVKVMFGGTPGAMLYAGPNQINVVAPEAIAEWSEVDVQVVRYGVPSARVRQLVVPARAGLFSYSVDGRRYAAALHPNGRLQGPSNPLTRGKAAMLFGTGLGLPPDLAANRIAARAAATPVTPEVFVGGKRAEVLYSGVSPGLTAGLAQINILIPEEAPTGEAIEVVIRVGDQQEGNTWLAIQ